MISVYKGRIFIAMCAVLCMIITFFNSVDSSFKFKKSDTRNSADSEGMKIFYSVMISEIQSFHPFIHLHKYTRPLGYVTPDLCKLDLANILT